MEKIIRPLCVIFLCLAIFHRGEAQTPKPPSEYEVKAAFLYNFVKFVEWPAQSFPDRTTPFLIGVLGEDLFGGFLDKAVEGKVINERKLKVLRADQLENLKKCHLIFISRSEKGRLNQILADLKTASILTVGDTERFAERGGVINFTMPADMVRFEINVSAAERAGLKISSKLLGVAKIITSEPSQEKK